jgi:hypothetical protein
MRTITTIFTTITLLFAVGIADASAYTCKYKTSTGCADAAR